VPHRRAAEGTFETTKVGKGGGLERLCAIEEVGEVKVGRVIADNDVRVALLYEASPFEEHLTLVGKVEDLGADDGRTGVEGKDVTDEGLRLACSLSWATQGGDGGVRGTLSGDHVCNLNDGIDARVGKDALATGTLDIEAEYAQRRDATPVALGRQMGDDIGVAVVDVSARWQWPASTHLTSSSI
jgi:hypothetical protein